MSRHESKKEGCSKELNLSDFDRFKGVAVLIKQELNYYTPQDIEIKQAMAKRMLELLNTMSLSDIKENYEYMREEPLFLVKYTPYSKEQVQSITDENREDLISYFSLGLNMYLTKLNNYEFLKTMNFNI